MLGVLNLQRTGLSTGASPVDNVLVQPVCRDILAFLLVRLSPSFDDAVDQLADAMPGSWRRAGNIPTLAHPALTSPFNARRWHWLAFNKNAIYLNEPSAIHSAGPRTLRLFPNVSAERHFPLASDLELQSTESLTVFQDHITDDTVSYGAPSLTLRQFWHGHALHGTPPPHIKSNDPTLFYAFFGPQGLLAPRTRAVVAPRAFADFESDQQFSTIYAGTDWAELGARWIIRWTGSDPRTAVDFSPIAETVPADPDHVFALWLLDDIPLPAAPASPLAEAWTTYLRQPMIPFDMAERRKQLAPAYRELAPEIERWERLTAKGWPYPDKWDASE